MPFISSFDIIGIVLLYETEDKGRPDPNIFLSVSNFCICCWADAAAVNPNGTKTLLAKGLIAFFMNGNPV